MDRGAMGGTQTLIDSEVGLDPTTACPNCGQQSGPSASVETSLFPSESLQRCVRCGTRYSTAAEARVVVSCDECGLPFLSVAPSRHEERRCSDCLGGRIPADLPDRNVAEATEREVSLALERDWSFVSAPSLSLYLNRLAAQICRRSVPAPEVTRVFLFEDAAWRTLALPSGTLLMSVGTLVSLEDEAELAFVLAHELAHAAAADAAVRLVRVGLHVVALENRGELAESWSHAALDLIRLGYGRARELEADRQAIDTVVALGYDPESALRYLHRVQSAVDAGDGRVRELALAHPTPVDRLRGLDKRLSGIPEPRVKPRVNREVFRRAAGHQVLASSLERVHGLEAAVESSPEERQAERAHRGFWLAVALTLLVALLAVLGWLAFLD